jgi:mRNA interferase MazF
MKRGEVWTVADAGYAGKPRPCVIVQSDDFEGLESVTICLLTSNPEEASHFRIEIVPSEVNGLKSPSRMMADKIVTVRRARLGRKIGALEEHYLSEFARAVIVFLGLEQSA